MSNTGTAVGVISILLRRRLNSYGIFASLCRLVYIEYFVCVCVFCRGISSVVYDEELRQNIGKILELLARRPIH